MGFFSGIGSAIGGLFSGSTSFGDFGDVLSFATDGATGGLGSLAAPLISGGLSYLGQSSANSANRSMSREQMAFQKMMSDTQYQRGVSDMKAAGLNPMLAYQQGGAGGASGSSYTAQNALGQGVTSSLDAKRAVAEVKNMEEVNNNLQVQSRNLQEQNKLIPAQTQEALDRARFLRQQSATEVARAYREHQAADIDRERMNLDRLVGLAQAENYLAAKRNYDANSAATSLGTYHTGLSTFTKEQESRRQKTIPGQAARHLGNTFYDLLPVFGRR